ncbi:cupin domain-containing protein [Pontibacter sp. H249]|uniref:cupin domain-containing protein n=1 Tax=Pontibacter sp. H249 TaxID=3133420 RepID=UPI0030C36792
MSKVNVSQHKLQPGQQIPNNPTLPVLYYPQAMAAESKLADKFKQVFEQNNWHGTWINGVFDYHHYHSKSHEVLGVAAGSAKVILGGPSGELFNLEAGDVVVLPAGTGHCLLSSSSDFKIVGAYPKGQENYDICTEKDDMAAKVRNIAKVPLPTHDPIAGVDGPLMHIWH